MPELPEVETTAADLRPLLIGQRITDAHVLWPRTVAAPDHTLFSQLVKGLSVVDVQRRGKYLLLMLDSGETLVVHLRMTGQLKVEENAEPFEDNSHVRIWFDLADGGRLVFRDQRKFGRMWLIADVAPLLARLGPEPLGADFAPEVLKERTAGRRAPIKALLLDQTVVAGLGNIYADEALFKARIHPQRPGSGLQDAEIVRLWQAIREVLQEALSARGTTLRDYLPPAGDRGRYQEQRLVYGRTGEPCPVCGTPVTRIVVAQRGTHFCAQCQPFASCEA